MSSPLDAVTGAKKPKRTRPAGAMFTVKIPLPPGSTGYAASLVNAAGEIVPPPFQQEGDNLVSHPDAWPASIRILTPGGGDFPLPFTPPASGTEAIVDLSRLAEAGGGSSTTPVEEVPPAPEENPYRNGGGGAQPLPNQTPPFGIVTIRGITPTLAVEIDGQAIAVSPEFPAIRVPEGPHRFVFKDVLSMANGPQNVPVRAEQTITVHTGDNLTVTPNFGPSWEAATRGMNQGGGGGIPWLLLLGGGALAYAAWREMNSDKGDE